MDKLKKITSIATALSPVVSGLLKTTTDTTDTTGKATETPNKNYEPTIDNPDDEPRGEGEEVCINDSNKTKCYCERAGYYYNDSTSECSSTPSITGDTETGSENQGNTLPTTELADNSDTHNAGANTSGSPRGTGKKTNNSLGGSNNLASKNGNNNATDLRGNVSTSDLADTSLIARAYKNAKRSRYKKTKKRSNAKISPPDKDIFKQITESYSKQKVVWEGWD